MLIQLLTTAQLLHFCFTDVSRSRNITEEPQVPMMRHLNHTMTPLQVTEAIELVDTTMAEQPNSKMVHSTGFQVSSAGSTLTDVPASAIITSSVDTITAPAGDKNDMSLTTRIGTNDGGKQQSNEVFKRRVIKMAVAPSNAPEVKNPSAPVSNYQSEITEQKPQEGQYGFEKKHR
ncbi:Uncharacterized protein BM_BM10252 [Brugia malayi]|uniref:Bm10252 n=1 Tax=Brugia malayi TaxID=6279 RepID=A0A0K0IML6_BRUMA|nr:Uncharacterized protein BM_BM10252 [Brugia malayi]CTP81419.1 Bm10252 [Brugia malayi]VIO92849.1 Uncharacterized protein BM_BM10252 [Brugia malayi]